MSAYVDEVSFSTYVVPSYKLEQDEIAELGCYDVGLPMAVRTQPIWR